MALIIDNGGQPLEVPTVFQLCMVVDLVLGEPIYCIAMDIHAQPVVNPNRSPQANTKTQLVEASPATDAQLRSGLLKS